MENKIYNDDVERIVNGKHNKIKHLDHKKIEKFRKNLFSKAVVFCVLGFSIEVAGLIGLVASWLALVLLFVFVALSAFCFGRFFETGKIWGWY